jgi:hypothetical protein
MREKFQGRRTANDLAQPNPDFTQGNTGRNPTRGLNPATALAGLEVPRKNC